MCFFNFKLAKSYTCTGTSQSQPNKDKMLKIYTATFKKKNIKYIYFNF